MRVALDTRPESHATGVGRYTRCLHAALQQTAAGEDELLALGRAPGAHRLRSAEVFHAPALDRAMLHAPCPMVVTLHALGPLARASERLRTGARTRLRALAVQRAAAVIVPTHAAAEEAERLLHIAPERIVVVAEAADEAMHPRSEEQLARVRERLGLPERYLLAVGGLSRPDPARNIAPLAAAARELPLVLVGPTRPWAHQLPDVILTGAVSDDDLAAIYTGAHALLLPGEGESFGLSAVEALACGAPVVAPDAPALREVLGERAKFVAPGDMHALIEAGQAASRPAPAPPEWSWQDAARSTWAVYQRAAAGAHRQRGAQAPSSRGRSAPAGAERARLSRHPGA